MLLYITFIVCQWFLLGKEIDYRLKIYFRVNSSMDRVAYRLLLGMCFFILYFNVISFFPPKWDLQPVLDDVDYFGPVLLLAHPG